MIEIENLRKVFGRTEAVVDLSLVVPEGQVTAFLGPNGAGKSTTIKCFLNLLRPDAGRATVLGCDSRKLGPSQFVRTGYVSESMELPLWLTVEEFLNYCRPLYPKWDSVFEGRLMKQFDLPPKARLGQLSRGMRMKAALLSSLVYRPKLVVLDEPFSGLDPLVRDEFIRGLLELTEQEGWTVFLSSHDIDEVQRLADRIALINRGRLALDESSEALQSRFRTVEVMLGEDHRVPTGLPADWLHVEQAGRKVRFIATRWTEKEETTDGARQTFLARFPGSTHVQAQSMTLREIFIALSRAYRLEDRVRPAGTASAIA